MPNADTDGRVIFKMINEFVQESPNSISFESLGLIRYLSCIKYVDGVIGNSSSGLIEVPSLKKGTINIGDRQKGRIRSESVIDCEPNEVSIDKAIKKLYSKKFIEKISKSVNPYEKKQTSNSIIKVLENVSYENILKKPFVDINNS